MNIEVNGKGLRYNKGKLRYDLAPAFAQQEYAKVLTMGADKYGVSNWRNGMKWSNVIASLERHLEAIKRGEDYDKESNLLHSAHIMSNAAFLTEYYKIYPQGDDRFHPYLSMPKIGIDIDGVLTDFNNHYISYFDNIEEYTQFHIYGDNEKKIQNIQSNKEFWTLMPIKTLPKDITFNPHCYITFRTVPIEWTQQWLLDNKYPVAPIYTINKIDADIKDIIDTDIIIDDKMYNFINYTKNNMCCYLYTSEYNKKYEVGFKRINDLSVFINGLK